MAGRAEETPTPSLVSFLASDADARIAGIETAPSGASLTSSRV
jgi:hypothetical protein